MHTFTPLENITIYTKNEPIELYEVFKSIKNNISKNPLPSVKASGNELRSFFEVALPEYDDDKVYTSDIVKILKMYSVLDSKGLISLEDKVDAEAQSETTKENKKAKSKVEKVATETNEVAPKKAKATKKKDA
jgi:flagellar motor component MotA